jgi:hypothetical protein
LNVSNVLVDVPSSISDTHFWLVGGFKHYFYFSHHFTHHIGNGKIIPTDELHHFSEG